MRFLTSLNDFLWIYFLAFLLCETCCVELSFPLARYHVRVCQVLRLSITYLPRNLWWLRQTLTKLWSNRSYQFLRSRLLYIWRHLIDCYCAFPSIRSHGLKICKTSVKTWHMHDFWSQWRSYFSSAEPFCKINTWLSTSHLTTHIALPLMEKKLEVPILNSDLDVLSLTKRSGLLLLLTPSRVSSRSWKEHQRSLSFFRAFKQPNSTWISNWICCSGRL